MSIRRPPRVAVEAAIRKSEGNLTRAAAILGVTRQSLYTWIYLYSLERLAGIRNDTPAASPSVYSARSGSRKNPPVDPEVIVPATVRLPETLWRSVRARAVWLGVSASSIVRAALEVALAEDPGPRKKDGNGDSGKKKKKNGNGNGGGAASLATLSSLIPAAAAVLVLA